MSNEQVLQDDYNRQQHNSKSVKRLFSSSTIINSSSTTTNKFFNLRNRLATSDNLLTSNLKPTSNCFSNESSSNKIQIDKNRFLAYLNLKPKPFRNNQIQKSTLKSAKIKLDFDKFKIDESKLDPSTSIFDQILKQNGYESWSFIKTKIEPESDDSSSILSTLKCLNLEDIRLLSPKKNYTRYSNEEYSCIYDYVTRIGGTCVPLDSFHHVLAYLKYTRSIQCVNSTQIQQNNLKFEFVFGDRHYWIVKIKRFNSDLFQMKFIRNITNNNNTSNETSSNTNSKKVDLNCTSDVSFNIDEISTKKENDQEIMGNTEGSPSSSRTTSPIPVVKQIEKTDSGNNHQDVNENESDEFDSVPISSYSWFFSNSDKSSLSNMLKAHFRPLGWSKKNGKILKKPTLRLDNDLYQLLVTFGMDKTEFADVRVAKDKEEYEEEDEMSYLTSSKLNESLSKYKENSYCELQDELRPQYVYIVKIKKNIAGRLLIEFLDNENLDDSWMHYLDSRLHQLGWANKAKLNYINLNYEAILSSNSQINDLDKLNISNQILNEEKANTSVDEAVIKIGEHELRQKIQLQVNYFVECLYGNKFYVARVIEIISEIYLKIELDYEELNQTSDSKKYLIINTTNGHGTSNSLHYLFPCKWCSQNNLSLERPNEWPKEKTFTWDEYVEQVRRKSPNEHIHLTQLSDLPMFNWSRNLNQLSDVFQLGMYLECVDTRRKQESAVCLAQIKAKIGHLIFLNLIRHEWDSEHDSLIIYPVDSHDLYPVGWCEMNNYYGSKSNHNKHYKYPVMKKIDETVSIREDLATIPHLVEFKNAEYWCNEIFLNTDRYCGPYFLKSKLNTIPKSYGPGPIVFVLYKIIQNLINVSEKPFKLLKLLQASRRNLNNNLNSSSISAQKLKYMQRLRVKAKEKGKYLFKELEICTRQIQLDEYLNDLCIKLKCCNKMLTTKANRMEENNEKKSINCANINCCQLCTVNYHSISLEYLINPEPAQSNTKTASFLTNNKRTIPFNKKTNLRLNKGTSLSNPKLKSPHLKAGFNNFSPIKTRLNVRQNLLASLRQQQIQKQIQEQELKQLEVLNSKNVKKKSLKNSLNVSAPIIDDDAKFKKLAKRMQPRDLSTGSVNDTNKSSSNEPAMKKQKSLKLIGNEETNNSKKHIKKTSYQADNRYFNDQDETKSTKYDLLMSNRNSRYDMSSGTNSKESNKNFIYFKPTINQANNKNNNNNNNNLTANTSFISNAGNNGINVNNNTNNICGTNGIKINNLNSNLNGTPLISLNSNPIYWSSKDVCKYLAENKFDSTLVYLIEEHEIDGQSFLMLNLPTIQNYMNLKLGPAIKLAHLVEKLKQAYFIQYETNDQTAPNLQLSTSNNQHSK